MVLHGRGTADAAGPAPTAPIPPAGQLYTEHAPPGWSQNADWVVDLAKDAPTPVVAADGTSGRCHRPGRQRGPRRRRRPVPLGPRTDRADPLGDTAGHRTQGRTTGAAGGRCTGRR